MKKRLFMLAVLLVLGSGVTLLSAGCGRSDTGHPAGTIPKYHCPMHPAVVSDKPGDCPICGMKLVPMDEAQAVPDRGTIPGLTTVSITPETRQRMGLTLGTVEKRPLVRNIRTSARIVADETRLFRVTTKIDGWVDKLFISTTGQAVRQGDPLLTIYSPQLVSAQQEYLSAVQSAGRLKDFARQRLQLWDISDEQIARLEKNGQVEKTMTLHAPASGFVMEKNVLAGQKIMPGEPLMVVADLSTVWGDADIYESDLPYITAGMPMELTLPYWPEKKFSGKVSFVSPSLDRETRTLKIRLEIPNPESLLKLEMYGDATLSYSLGEKLVAPESAIMKTGERTYAFRADGDGKLVPVEVKVGVRNDGYYEVRSGLNEGDRIVTSANFLVDSESSMRAALEALSGK